MNKIRKISLEVFYVLCIAMVVFLFYNSKKALVVLLVLSLLANRVLIKMCSYWIGKLEEVEHENNET